MAGPGTSPRSGRGLGLPELQLGASLGLCSSCKMVLAQKGLRGLRVTLWQNCVPGQLA